MKSSTMKKILLGLYLLSIINVKYYAQSSTVQRVLLGGGSGFLGSSLKQAFERNGFSVITVSRNSGSGKITWNELSQNGMPDDVLYVVNTAGENVLNPLKRWNEKFKEEIASSRVHTNEILRKAVDEAKHKPEAILSMSGVGAYKPDRNKTYDEKSEVQPFDFFSELVLRWEKAIDNDSGVRKIVVRSGVILGKTGGMIKQIYLPFFLGLGGPMGSGAQYFPWIHIDDLVEVILYSLMNKRMEGVVNGVAPEIITNKQFSDAFAKSLHRPAFFPLPSPLVRLIFGNERAVMVLEGQKVSPSKLQSEIGFKFLYPTIESAVQEIVRS